MRAAIRTQHARQGGHTEDTEDSSTSGGGGVGDHRRPSERLLPIWWLAYLGLYGLCNAAAVTLFDLVLFPARIAELVGEERKHAVLGALTTLYTGLHFSLPFFGAVSDRLRSRLGRRRPFVVGGQLLAAAGVLGAQHAADPPTFTATFAAYHLGRIIGYVPSLAIIPELVPPAQRGVAAGWINALYTGGTLGGSLATVLLGRGVLSPAASYSLAVGGLLLSVPVGLLAMNARYSSC
eukprot:SAG11_NODE_102_length_16709_cov_31.066093_2_plen_236_part_00